MPSFHPKWQIKQTDGHTKQIHTQGRQADRHIQTGMRASNSVTHKPLLFFVLPFIQLMK